MVIIVGHVDIYHSYNDSIRKTDIEICQLENEHNENYSYSSLDVHARLIIAR